MIYTSLRSFIKKLEKDDQLIRIAEPVSTFLEITEIHKRVIQNQGPALLFENIITPLGKNDIPVLVNLFGTKERIAKALNTKVDNLRELGKMLAFLRQPEAPQNMRESIKMFPMLKKVLDMKPKEVKNAPCQEIILTGNDININKLPIQTCWPAEPAPLITWPLVVTKGPDNSKREDNFNLGIYRMQVTGSNTTLMRWLKHRGGAQQFQRWKEKHNKPFPAAAIIGATPAITLAAVCPIPETMSEYQFAGLLGKAPVELIRCKTIPLKVPAQAEIIIEGHISLTEEQDEGPYGDHTGYYNSIEKFPVFTISAITTRKKPIYLSTYTGKPPDEPSILGEALNEIFIPFLTQQFPEITDFYLPQEGCSYRIAIVSIKKSYPGQAKRTMMAIWSYLKQFMYTKFIIVVDDDINIRDWKEVMWAISTRMDPARDMTFVENTPIDYLDFASPYSGLGSKVGLDATNKLSPETHREWGKPIKMQQDIIDKITKNWSKYNIP